jgi:hypothetical protein
LLKNFKKTLLTINIFKPKEKKDCFKEMTSLLLKHLASMKQKNKEFLKMFFKFVNVDAVFRVLYFLAVI